MLHVDCISAFQDNYIWLIHTGGNRVAAVDPGDAGPVLAALRAGALELHAILITHRHRDHTGGIPALTTGQSLPVYGPAGEAIPGVTHPLRGGDQVTLGEVTLQVLETPGHTLGHICYLAPGALFSGDTLFTAGCGRLFEGTPDQMHASLEKLRALPDETLVYCAHEYTLDGLRFARLAEPANDAVRARQAQSEALRAAGTPTVPARLRVEKQTNPFLRTREPALAAAAAAFAGRPLATPAEVFAAVRQWKDSAD
jgi:hydroxyacylglutathione hydrolase